VAGQKMSESKSDGVIDMVKYFFRSSAESFNLIPDSPVVYWLSDKTLSLFSNLKSLSDAADLFKGLSTGENAVFVRSWHEVSVSAIYFDCQSNMASKNDLRKWYPCNKGGAFRKWYGNQDSIINWERDGRDLRALTPKSVIRSPQNYFRPCLSWSKVTGGSFSMRYFELGFIPLDSTSALVSTSTTLLELLAIINATPFSNLLASTSATINFELSQLGRMPIRLGVADSDLIQKLVDIGKLDWQSQEISWDFTQHPLLDARKLRSTLKVSYQELFAKWRDTVVETQLLEQENNRIFIDAYGLQDELTPAVPLNEITLTCNPHYRYGGDKTEEELEALLLADTMREFISYAVGCMFGRYALDKPGLVLANQGETIEDYRRRVPNSRFEADADNVIPMLDGEWFADDVTERFRQFLRVTFGDDHYDENLDFIEQALNPKGKRNFTLRDYMLGEFYTDHVKRYKKRPIYWLFSSPKGTFNALIYLHRYRPDTASVVLRYLREFRAKLAARQSTLEQVLINPATSQGEKTKAVKEIDGLKKQIIELQDYENDTLYPLATANVVLDLDDGVKVNYLKLGAALKKIAGLDTKDED
jgi:hypothetical protein